MLEYLKFVKLHVLLVCLLNTPSSFVLLFILFVVVLETNEIDNINIPEWIFIIYAFGKQIRIPPFRVLIP